MNNTRRNGNHARSHCDCGTRASVVLNGYNICQRCYTLDKEREDRCFPNHGELTPRRNEVYSHAYFDKVFMMEDTISESFA
jgi:hypothetical protein